MEFAHYKCPIIIIIIIRIQKVGFCGWIKENQYNYNFMLFVGKCIVYSKTFSKKNIPCQPFSQFLKPK